MNVPHRDGITERLVAMVRLSTVDEPGNEQPFIEFEALLAELYPLVHQRLDKRKITDRGLLFHWQGRNRAADPVVLMAHWDVVPAIESDGWTYPPFSGTVADGMVWGRGTLDDKGPLCVLLEGVENLLAAGVVPERDVYLSLGGNEETYGGAAQAIAADFRERGSTPWLVIDEGGAVVEAPMPQLPVPAAMVGVAEKGVMTVELRARGAAGHASAPGHELATTRITRAVQRLQRRQFPARLPASTRAMFALLAQHTPGKGRALGRFVSRVPWLAAPVLARMGGEPAALVRTTIAATMLSGGTAANVLPSTASAILNLRLAPGVSVDSAVAHLRSAISDPAVEILVHEADEATPESPRSGPQFELIAAAVSAAYPGLPTIPYIQMSATDSRHFHQFCPAVYRFAPLEMDATQRASIHAVDEHIAVSTLPKGVSFYHSLIAGLPA